LKKVLPVVTEESAHSSLGASTAARWMACPGSINLIEHLPDFDYQVGGGESYAAREGTVAHSIAAEAMNLGLTAAGYRALLPEKIIGGVEVTDDMLAHVQTYLDHTNKVRSIPGVIYWIERKFSLEILNPPVPMFGTSDFSAYDPATKTLYVDDLKYGAGVAVEITGNVQTRYYALGVWLSLDGRQYPVERVVMTIVQPRKEHPEGFIRSEEISIDDLALFANELLEAARATLDPAAPLQPGGHCRFCPAKAVCPALYEQTQQIAASEFDVVTVVAEPLTPAEIKNTAVGAPLRIRPAPVEEIVLPPIPEALSHEQIAKILTKLPILDDWSAAVKAYAEKEAKAGRPIPGFKIVERRAERKWTNENAAARAILEQTEGVPENEIYETPKLKSPAKIEKALGKRRFKALASFVTKKSAGTKLVPESDPRPALTAGSEFELLPEATSDNDEGKDKKGKE